MDISKLTPQQRELAFKIGERSAKRGLNPDFILPMVMQESSFDHSKVSPQGAKGVMQITDDTARLYKCDDPTNLDKNIDCGLNIIQDLVSKKNIGNDPYKVLAGYHSGEPEAATFLKTGNIDDLGPNAKQHLWDVSQRYGAELPNVLGGQQPEKDSAPAVPALPVTDNPENKASQPSIAPPDQVPPPAQLNPLFGIIPGAQYGAGAGTALALADAKFNAASGFKDAYDALLGRSAPAPVVPPTATVAPPIAPAPVVEPVPTSTAPKHGGQNWVKSLTNVDLPAAQMSKTDLDLAKGMQKAVGIGGEQGFTGGKITQGGVIINPQTASAIDAKTTEAQKFADRVRLMREARARIAAQAAEQSKAAEAAMLARGEGQAVQAATHAPTSSPLAQYLKRVASFPIKGALAGAGAGFSAIDALNRFNQKDEKGNRDISGAVLSGLGGAAGVAAPFVASMGALPAASIALPLYLSAEDRIKYLKKHPEAQQLVEDEYDPMGNRQR
jgi:hypothetical protein